MRQRGKKLFKLEKAFPNSSSSTRIWRSLLSVVSQPDIAAKAVDTKRYLKVVDVAALMDVPVSTVYELARQNRINGTIRFGRHIRFDRDKLEQWLRAGGETGTA